LYSAGVILAAIHLPAPLIDSTGEGQEGDLLQRLVHQQADVREVSGALSRRPI